MRTININNQEELKRFKSEISDYMWINETDIIPYCLNDGTKNGANYTLFVPLKWKNKLSPARLHAALRNNVDADSIKIEYINFIRA